MEGKDTSRGKDLKRQIANFEELVGNILSTGERAGKCRFSVWVVDMEKKARKACVGLPRYTSPGIGRESV